MLTADHAYCTQLSGSGTDCKKKKTNEGTKRDIMEITSTGLLTHQSTGQSLRETNEECMDRVKVHMFSSIVIRFDLVSYGSSDPHWLCLSNATDPVVLCRSFKLRIYVTCIGFLFLRALL